MVARLLLQKNPDRDVFKGEKWVTVFCTAPFLYTGKVRRLVGTETEWFLMDAEAAANRYLWLVGDFTADLYTVAVSDMIDVPPVLPTTDLDHCVAGFFGPPVHHVLAPQDVLLPDSMPA